MHDHVTSVQLIHVLNRLLQCLSAGASYIILSQLQITRQVFWIVLYSLRNSQGVVKDAFQMQPQVCFKRKKSCAA